jgi:hypothetical protein
MVSQVAEVITQQFKLVFGAQLELAVAKNPTSIPQPLRGIRELSRAAHASAPSTKTSAIREYKRGNNRVGVENNPLPLGVGHWLSRAHAIASVTSCSVIPRSAKYCRTSSALLGRKRLERDRGAVGAHVEVFHPVEAGNHRLGKGELVLDGHFWPA